MSDLLTIIEMMLLVITFDCFSSIFMFWLSCEVFFLKCNKHSSCSVSV